MPKTKLESAKDALTATNGLIECSQSLYKLCVENLGEDLGVYQIIALLRLTQQDLELRVKLLSDFS